MKTQQQIKVVDVCKDDELKNLEDLKVADALSVTEMRLVRGAKGKNSHSLVCSPTCACTGKCILAAKAKR